MLESLRLSWLGSDVLLGSAFTDVSLLLDFCKETTSSMKVFTKTGFDCCMLESGLSISSWVLYGYEWCPGAKSWNPRWLTAFLNCSHKQAGVWLLLLSSKNASQLWQTFITCRFPPWLICQQQLLWRYFISVTSTTKMTPNPDSFSTARGRAADVFHTLYYRLTSKLDLKDHPQDKKHKWIPLTFLPRSTRITVEAGRSKSSLFSSSFCALVRDQHWHSSYT